MKTNWLQQVISYLSGVFVDEEHEQVSMQKIPAKKTGSR